MKRMPFVVALVCLSLGVAHSWDIATSSGNRIDFFKNDTITHSMSSHQFKNLTALAYDALHDTLLIVDQQTDNSSLYRFNFTSNDFQAILTTKEIISFAIDPVKELLFWIEDKSIHSMTLKPSHENNLNERVVLRLDEENPRAIAVDSCSGFVYWTSTSSMKPAIEKVRFDGSDRAVLIDQDIQEPHRLVIDPQINKMFWIDIRHDDTCTYRVKYSDLEGNNKDELLHGTNLPRALTLSKDFVYLIENQQKAVWKDSKLHILGTLKQIGSSYSEIPSNLAVAVQNRLEFYTKEDKIIVESDLFRDAAALAYDDAHQTILFIKKHTDNASICSFEMSTQKHKVLVTAKDIGGFTIDPIRAVLYWTDIAERSIFWISFKQGYKEIYNKNLLIKMEDEIPRAIAVDICKGYVYWTNTNSTKPTIERVRFDGTEKEVLVDESTNDPVSLAIDQQTLKMFWADNTRNKKYRIFSTELDGKNKTELISDKSNSSNIGPSSLSSDLSRLVFRDLHAVANRSSGLPQAGRPGWIEKAHILRVNYVAPRAGQITGKTSKTSSSISRRLLIMETLNRQATIQEEIERQFTNFKKDGKDRKTVEYMEKRIEALDQYWIEFRKNHDVLLNVLASEHDYFMANNLERTRDLYYKARTVYQTTLAELEKASARTHQGGTSKTGEAKHEQGAGTHLGTTGNQQPSTSTYNPNLPQGNNTKIDEMLRKQSSNFRAFLRTLESIDVEELKEKWEYEDALTSIKARWKIVDNLHWELDSQLMGSNNEYEETFTQYERKYNDIKKAINSKLCRKPEYQMKEGDNLCQMGTSGCKTIIEPCSNFWIESYAINTYLYFCCNVCNVRTICTEDMKAHQLKGAGLINIGQGCLLRTDKLTIYPYKVHSSEIKISPDLYAPTIAPINDVINITLPQWSDENKSYLYQDTLQIGNRIHTLMQEDQVLAEAEDVSYHDIHHYVMIYVIIGIIAITGVIFVIRRVHCRWQVPQAAVVVDSSTTPPLPSTRRLATIRRQDQSERIEMQAS
ncbi:hypothetical protein B5X24_HaOG215588 [Helicoverpa armigera]|uniref:Uncharacterized protein n=1 Tax=Helicoverpa armigera TaxID=29058 RepID=A0A2W1BFY8_HELAM|nr:hypothetical protein B5X24_HaOG215588 [Helicoverpa armigera]